MVQSIKRGFFVLFSMLLIACSDDDSTSYYFQILNPQRMTSKRIEIVNNRIFVTTNYPMPHGGDWKTRALSQLEAQEFKQALKVLHWPEKTSIEGINKFIDNDFVFVERDGCNLTRIIKPTDGVSGTRSLVELVDTLSTTGTFKPIHGSLEGISNSDVYFHSSEYDQVKSETDHLKIFTIEKRLTMFEGEIQKIDEKRILEYDQFFELGYEMDVTPEVRFTEVMLYHDSIFLRKSSGSIYKVPILVETCEADTVGSIR